MDLRGIEPGIGQERREFREASREMPVPLLILIPAQNPAIPAKFPIPNP
jgi:hypothetical protein